MKNKTVKFKKEFLMDELGLPYDADDGVLIKDDVVDTDRWSTIHVIVFKHGNAFYETSYSVGSTEMQDERPWDYNNEVTCTEVVPTEETVIVYKPVKVEG